MITTEANERSPWGRRFLIGCLTPFLLAVCLPISYCRWQDQHPSTDDLRSLLVAKKATYEQLRKSLLSEPRVNRVSYDFARFDGFNNFSDDGVQKYMTRQRWEMYRQLMRDAKLESGIERNPDGSVSFYNSSRGLSIGGSSKGLLWANVPPSPLVKSDAELERHCKAKNCFVFLRIDGDWYIEYEYHS
jgi:hypothetical protein